MWLFHRLRLWGSHGLRPGDSISWTQMGSPRRSPSLPGARFGPERGQGGSELKEEEKDLKEDWKLLKGHLGLLPTPGLPSATVVSDSLSSSIHSRVMRTWPPLFLLSWPFLRGRCMGGTSRRPAGRDKRWAVPPACQDTLLYSQELKARGSTRGLGCAAGLRGSRCQRPVVLVQARVWVRLPGWSPRPAPQQLEPGP